ncbi:MAG: Lrp/AsnC ligand binding domain-containing protein [Alistipes sp.]|nr:Lrp/AsnC ligand binding domain-containing protein [Alistipes sp.]
MGHYQLDALDIQILRMVANNARIPYLEVARECNVSGAAIHQRIQKMMSLGVLSGSEFKLNPTKIGLETCAFVGLYLKEPSEFDRVVEALEQIPEVVECHYTTGKYDLFIKMYVKGNAELKDVIHDKLLPLGLARTETLISFNEVFRRQMPIPDAD